MSNEVFNRARYVSLRTYRKSGVAVDTPVWCALSESSIWVFSESRAGKIKRLRKNPQVQFAECDYGGKLLGDWVDATAEIVEAEVDVLAALKSLRQKYGWQMLMADWGSKLTGKFKKRAYIKVVLNPP